MAEAEIEGAAEEFAAGAATERGGSATGRATTGIAATGAEGAGRSTGVVTEGRGGAAGGRTGDAADWAATGAADGFATDGGTATGLGTDAAVGGATGGTAGGAGVVAAAPFCCVMALSTSPGREMFDRSILVLISSSPRVVRADFDVCPCASALARKWTRTLSASFSSRELECVFFSVTPTASKTSRIALLLTSNSLARSLIRTLLIRPFFRPALCLSLHRSLTGSFVCLARN